MKYADAWHSSRKTGRPMLLFVTAQNCHFCRKMEQESYGKPQIMTTIERNFEAVAIDNSVSPDLVRKLRVRVFPTTFIVAPDGKIVGRIEGFIGPEQLATYLEPAARTAQAGPRQPASTDGEEKK
ncbi:MAG: thioredoxin family protein [Pirellulales bacterium]|nr:thioredoxin family protein [Pirellulales bacterium]